MCRRIQRCMCEHKTAHLWHHAARPGTQQARSLVARGTLLLVQTLPRLPRSQQHRRQRQNRPRRPCHSRHHPPSLPHCARFVPPTRPPYLHRARAWMYGLSHAHQKPTRGEGVHVGIASAAVQALAPSHLLISLDTLQVLALLVHCDAAEMAPSRHVLDHWTSQTTNVPHPVHTMACSALDATCVAHLSTSHAPRHAHSYSNAQIQPAQVALLVPAGFSASLAHRTMVFLPLRTSARTSP